MKKKKIVIGNWKMNPETFKEAKELSEGIRKKMVGVKKTTAVVCPPHLYFMSLKPKNASTKLFYGLQNIAREAAGSFTGELSATMARNCGVTYTIIGHSERRALGETDDDVNKKVLLALKEGIKAVICVGESKVDEHAGHLTFIKNQIVTALKGVTTSDIGNVLIAYEPLSAIGAKNPITSYEIHQRNIFIKKVLCDLYGKAKAFDIPVLYGGSANAMNAKELVEGGEVDGLLVGRDSLKVDNFIAILKEMDSIS